nr:cupredoxin domain-containing protein [uncultured Sphingosinicella sp.]
MYRLLIPALLIASPAAAAPDWRQSRDFEVRLSNNDIEPQRIQLRAGEPVRLRIVNIDQTGHSFSAGAFLSRAQVRNRDKRWISGGSIAVPAGDVREVVLVPAPGRYRARCGNLVHRILGMSSEIVVE